jgi:hypothetical protein
MSLSNSEAFDQLVATANGDPYIVYEAMAKTPEEPVRWPWSWLFGPKAKSVSRLKEEIGKLLAKDETDR